MRSKLPILEKLLIAIFNAIFNFFQVSGKRDLGPVKSQEKLFPDTWDLSSLRKNFFLRLGNWNFFFSMKTLIMHFFPYFFSMKTSNMHFFPFKFVNLIIFRSSLCLPANLIAYPCLVWKCPGKRNQSLRSQFV